MSSMLLNKEEVRSAYEDVRDNVSDTTWVVFKYEGKTIKKSASGTDYSDFLEELGDDDRCYCYLRIQTGDEMSKRAKFVFLTWLGPNVSSLQRAKVSTDKMFVKEVLQNFAVEILAEDKKEISLDTVTEEVRKAGGANYGTGQRD